MRGKKRNEANPKELLYFKPFLMRQMKCARRALLFFLFAFLLLIRAQVQEGDLKIWFNHPATSWNEALPVGNGRLGAMVFGGVATERLQLNEETVWTGRPADFVNPEAQAALPQVRALLFSGKYAQAQQLAEQKLMGNKTGHSTYQTLGDLELDFGPVAEVSEYRRELDLETALARVSYRAGKVAYAREILASAPDPGPGGAADSR
jgi:alpha-L-fucosidase 2